MTLNRISPGAARRLRRPVLQAAIDTSARCRDRPEYNELFNRTPGSATWTAQQAGAQSFCAECPARAVCEELALRYGKGNRTSDDLVRGGRRGQDLAVTREIRQPRRIAAAVTADRLELAREQYTLAYTTKAGPVTRRRLRRQAVERVGEVAMRAADRGEVWDVAVYDKTGADVTFDFAFASQDRSDLPVAA
ncbi:WhiB family transcriptional regulator [Streptomyces sp. NPDC002785]|uniref:WhiB family transcriptional regulator n=1 Tax=Streptomyces sp. NPDC002785 TaxID=3154543 RepID=UPI003332542D